MKTFDKKEQLRRFRNNATNPIFMVVDGNYVLHRAKHAYPSVKVSGVEVGMIQGALNMVCSDYADLKPHYVAIAFDLPGKNFRHQIDPNYKLNNLEDEGHAEFFGQQLATMQLFRLLGFPVLALQGVEADDVIGSLVVTAQNNACMHYDYGQGITGTSEGNYSGDLDIVVFSGDKDLCQFVREDTVIVDTKTTGGIRDTQEVTRKYGVHPSQIADYLALCGDNNDGISGLPQCGPATAKELLRELGNVERILSRENLPERWGKLLTPSNLAILRQCYALSKIRTDINVVKYAPYTLRKCNVQALRDALSRLHLSNVPSLVNAQLERACLKTSLFSDVTPEKVSDDFEDGVELQLPLFSSSSYVIPLTTLAPAATFEEPEDVT